MTGNGIVVFHPFSQETAGILHVFILTLIVCGVILLIVSGIIGIGLVRFREQPGAAEPRPGYGNRKLEILWTVGPVLIVIWLFALTAHGMRQVDPPANQEPDLVVVGHQWWWEVRYSRSGVVTANEIHVPVGRKWLVRLESADVIHNFWVPALARKIQMIPGQTNHVWLEADAPGNYEGICAEYCGPEHAWMRFSVIADPPAEFEAWLQEQAKPASAPAGDSARRGMKIFQAMTCVSCHTIRGLSTASGAAPDLTHVGARETLGAGLLSNTETNLFRWLKNSQAIKPGCFMPNLKLTDAQAGALTGYLEALK